MWDILQWRPKLVFLATNNSVCALISSNGLRDQFLSSVRFLKLLETASFQFRLFIENLTLWWYVSQQSRRVLFHEEPQNYCCSLAAASEDVFVKQLEFFQFEYLLAVSVSNHSSRRGWFLWAVRPFLMSHNPTVTSDVSSLVLKKKRSFYVKLTYIGICFKRDLFSNWPPRPVFLSSKNLLHVE